MAADTVAREVQAQIDVLQAELHNRVKSHVVAGNLRRNAHFSERHDVLAAAIERGELPRTFWADAIIAALGTPAGAGAGGSEGRLLGSYDAALLRDYLRDMRVEYTRAGVKVTLTFAPNPFFEETVLWGEERHYADDQEEEAAGEEKKENTDNTNNKSTTNGDNNNNNNNNNNITDSEVCRFSGITWKPGHGPDDDDEDGEEDENNGAKRKRERSPGTTRGWSFLEVFSAMLPHPEDDDAFDEEDDEDEFADAVENWETEMEDRRDLLLTLVEDVWCDPLAALKGAPAVVEEEGMERDAKRAR